MEKIEGRGRKEEKLRGEEVGGKREGGKVD